jgi:hypothetical protein
MKKFWYGTTGAALGLLTALAVSCGPIPDYRTLAGVDLHPPQFLGALAVAPRTVVMRFDEPVVTLPATATIVPAITVTSVTADGSELSIGLAADQQVGAAYAVEVSVEDESKNSTTVMTGFYGFNPDIPGMLINEFTTQGSSRHPDLVELLVLDGGNTAGMCLYEGMPDNWDDRFVFPAIVVDAGDFLLVHFKPKGLPEEIDEIDRTDLSGGLDAAPNAYDLWVEGGTGLSGNNGVLSLYSSPDGRILDAAVYSNRTSKSDTDYAGFGSKAVYERVRSLEPTGEWHFSGDHIAPEDAIDPDPSTSTRSIARGSAAADTNGRSDWHITPTSGSTFGERNTDKVYVP